MQCSVFSWPGPVCSYHHHNQHQLAVTRDGERVGGSRYSVVSERPIDDAVIGGAAAAAEARGRREERGLRHPPDSDGLLPVRLRAFVPAFLTEELFVCPDDPGFISHYLLIVAKGKSIQSMKRQKPALFIHQLLSAQPIHHTPRPQEFPETLHHREPPPPAPDAP